MKKVLILVLLYFTFSVAQSETNKDTIRVYRLGEIVTEGTKGSQKIQPTKIKEVKYHEIKEQDAVNMQDLNAIIPGGFIQTNSRGESLLYLRGAGERSIALFFDGMYFNIPWDNRVDLSMIPTDIIGNLKISSGANSVLYGANVLGGAVNITTTERDNDGLGGNVGLQLGEGGRKYSNVKLEGKEGKFNYIGNLSFLTRDGLKAPKDNSFDFNLNKDNDLITNSYSERITAYLRGEYEIDDENKIGASFNHIDGQQGAIPENYPNEITRRFWKYPEWLRSIATVNGEFKLSEMISVKGAVWVDKFNQTIEDYKSISFAELNEKQYDEDITTGLRVNFSANLSDNDKLNFAINGFNTTHTEEIDGLDGSSVVNEYAQMTSSFGLEYKRFLGDWVFTIGSSYDRFDISKAGVFTEAEGSSFDDIAGVLGATYKLSESTNLFANLGKKNRFPTLRESYSAALGKFVVNPDLKPESGLLSEVGIDYHGEDLDATLSLFANNYTDLIAQSSVPGDTLRRKQRVNLDEATIMGAEVLVKYYVTNDFDLTGHFTYMNSKGTVDGIEQNLEYRPEIIAFLQADWRVYGGLDLLAEADLMGNQYGISDLAEGLVPIDATTLFNLRLSYKTFYNENLYTFFIRANNLLDQARLNKIAISSPGRMIYGGVNVAF
ncbi:MAG: TonB-dependent receptor [Candidatus Kapaibacterium sp.]